MAKKTTESDLAKLSEFADLLADPSVSDEQIAEVAEVPVALVAKARALRASVAAAVSTDEAEAVNVEHVEPAPVAFAPPAESAPLMVKVVARGLYIERPGAIWNPRRGDVYSGADAAFLWAEHREAVRPYQG